MSDLALTAVALARDLSDTQGSKGQALLHAAAHEAARHLDASGLGREAFAAALRRLTSIRTRIDAMLVGTPRYASATAASQRRRS